MIQVKNLKKTYRVKQAKSYFKHTHLVAVNDVSLALEPGKTLGLVGESGCGKSTLSRLVTLLEKPDEGQILFDGKDVNQMAKNEVKVFRREVQMIFQDPMSSMNPRMRVRSVLSEPFDIHKELKPKKMNETVFSLLNQVGLSEDKAHRYPHELSGGERQRVCIARAIALKPKIIICDESVSSLDVLVRAQILNLLLKLQRDHGLGYLFISHDLRVVRHMSDDILVMSQGKIVEEGNAQRIFYEPKEDYTQRLLDSVNLEHLS